MLYVSIALLIVLMAIGVPVAVSILAAATSYFVVASTPDVIVIQRMVSGLESFPLLAVPFFILAGTAMARGGIAERLLAFAETLVGHQRGGLGQVNVLNSLMMGGMSGSANADAAVDAKVLVPVMRRHGYPLGFSSALSASTSLIAPIIPPGIGLIVYGMIAQVSVGRLFLGGIVPGILLAIAMGAVVRIMSSRRGYGEVRPTRAPLKEVLTSGRRATWALLMPVLLIVGLRGGVFTPTELGAIAAVYAMAIGMFVYKGFGPRDVIDVLRESVVATAIVMLIVAASAAFSAIITMERLPQALVGALTTLSDNRFVLMVIIAFAILLLGSVIESVSLLVMLTPIVAPLAVELGFDPVQFGVVVVLLLTIGLITPPVGTVLYTVCSITGCDVADYTRNVAPFILAAIVVVALMIAYPPIVTFLPDLLG